MTVKIIPPGLLRLIGEDRETYRFFLEVAEQALNENPVTLNVTRITSTDSPYTATTEDNVLMCDTDGGAISLGLPAGYKGRSFRILNVGSSSNNVTVNPDGTETIFTDASLIVYDGEVIDIVWEETEDWR